MGTASSTDTDYCKITGTVGAVPVSCYWLRGICGYQGNGIAQSICRKYFEVAAAQWYYNNNFNKKPDY